MAFKSGDRVKIVTRDVAADDVKAGLYYEYFGGLTGVVDRVYDDGSVCVDIDLESLNEDMRERHLAMQETERKRWLDNLSGEVRSRLTEDQRRLTMNYKILVSAKDLEPDKGGKPKGASTARSQAAADTIAEDKKGPAKAPEPPKRLSEADISAAEEAFLKSLQDRSQQ